MRESSRAEDPSLAFGREEGLFVYHVAASMTGDTDRPVIDRAGDAARTAIRQHGRTDIDAELATRGLMSALEKGLGVDKTSAES